MQTPQSGDDDVATPREALEPSWFGVPSLPDHYVSRPRLLSALDRAGAVPLILLSAPAGSGKTSLVAEWLASPEHGRRAEWVTFESGEQTFWPALVACLERAGVPVSARAFSPGSSSQDRRVLTTTAAAVSQHPERVAVVLDGYELVSSDVADDLDFLLRHSGHRLQLVMITRADPVLPLYRYRLEGSLVELRMSHLAFTEDETVDMLSRAGLTLEHASVAALVRRTAGWATGLRFSVGILRGRDDLDTAISQVTGDDGNIAEYLIGEVLSAQPPTARALLLRTSLPDVLHPGLVTALAGHSAQRGLASLVKQNAFIEPVPEHPGLFRYHPFFRELLRSELAYEAPQELVDLHRTAAEWFAREGLLAQAVDHYAAIDAWADGSACVVDQLAVAELILGDSEARLPRALKLIPEQLDDPAVTVVRAAMALSWDGADGSADSPIPVRDTRNPSDEHQRAMSVWVTVLRMVRAQCHAEPRRVVELADAAEELLRSPGTRERAREHPELIALVKVCKGIAVLRLGRFDEAQVLFDAVVEAGFGAGTEVLLLESLGSLAMLACLRDQPTRARALAADAAALADRCGIRHRDLPACVLVAGAWADVEQFQLRSAAREVEQARHCSSLSADPVSAAWLDIIAARLLAANGELTAALRTMEAGASTRDGGHDWLAGYRRLERADLWLAAGEPGIARAEVIDLEDAHPVQVALVQARALLAQGADDEVGEALTRVLVRDAPASAVVTGWLVEATRQQRRGSLARASAAIQRARRHAVAEQLRRPFESTSPELAPLTRFPGYRNGSAGPPAGRTSAAGGAEPDTPPPVVEKLTAKEVEVLGLLAELLTTQEMATTLCVSVNTIRTHVRNILRKLGVTRRNAAVRRARQLELLPVAGQPVIQRG